MWQNSRLNVSCVGASKPEHILDNINAVNSAPLAAEQLKQIDEIAL